MPGAVNSFGTTKIGDTYLDGTLVRRIKKCAEQKLAKDIKSLRPEEAAVLMLLQGNLKSRL